MGYIHLLPAISVSPGPLAHPTSSCSCSTPLRRQYSSCHPLIQYIILTCSFAGNSEPSFVFPTVIGTQQSAGPRATSSASAGGRAPPPVAGKPGHLASKRGIEDLDFYIGDEALANAK